MKIYSFYYTHKPGGFCKRLYRLLSALALDGHEVNYCCLDRPPQSLSNSVKWLKIPFPFKARDGYLFWILFSIWAPIFCFWNNFTRGQSARWVVFSPYYAALLAPIKIILGSSIICFIRSKLAVTSESSFIAAVESLSPKICFKCCDKLILQTRANSALAVQLGCNPSKIQILPNNIDQLLFAKSEPSSTLKILSTGVFTKIKNLNFLLEVWTVLKSLCLESREPCPKLHIIGVIRDQDFVNNNQENVSISPWTKDLSKEYSESDLYLHPSLHEGMPNSVLEAMSFGMAVMVADTPELLELVKNQNLSFSVRFPAQLAQQLLELQRNPEKLDLLKVLSRERAKTLCFDWDLAAEELVCN